MRSTGWRTLQRSPRDIL